MFRIQIDSQFQPGALSRSSTIGEGIYRGTIDTTAGIFKLTPQTDFNRQPASLHDAASPLAMTASSSSVSLGPRPVPGVRQGDFGNLRAHGRATLVYDIGVVFRVLTDVQPPPATVTLLATGMMDGITSVVPNSLVPGTPEATLEATIEIVGLEKAVASSSASGSVTVSHGLTLSTEALGIGPGSSKQITLAGNSPRTFSILKPVPVNQPLVCRITASLMAKAGTLEIPIIGPYVRESAAAVLMTQYVFLIPDPPGTAVVSSTSAKISVGAGGPRIELAHPLAELGVVQGPRGLPDNSLVDVGVDVDYSGFRPEVEWVLLNGTATPDDPLRGALLGYPDLSVSGVGLDGSVQLTGGPLQFIDAANGGTLATAQLTDVRATLTDLRLTASVTEFTPATASVAASPVAMRLQQNGGTLTLGTDVLPQLLNPAGVVTSGPPTAVLITPNV